jgi:hypothetical protein
MAHPPRVAPFRSSFRSKRARARINPKIANLSAAKNLDSYRIDLNAYARVSTDASRWDEKKAVNYRVRVQ